MQFGTAIGASDAQSSPIWDVFPHLTGIVQFLKASKFKLTTEFTDDIGILIYHVTLTHLIYHYQAFHNEHLSVANK